MNISVVADFADLLAALGVIGSVLFLALQVRQNTQVIGVQNLAQRHLLASGPIIANSTRPLDERVATILDKGKLNFDNLSDPEKLTFGAWAFEFIASNNRTIDFASQGLVPPGIAAMPQRNLQWFFRHPGMSQWWRDPNRQPIPDHYETVVDKALSELEQNPS